MENEIKTNEGQQAPALGLLNAKDVVVSVVKVTAEGVSIKLWPDADAVRGVLGEAAQLAQVPGGYSLRRYVCGRALYCAVRLGMGSSTFDRAQMREFIDRIFDRLAEAGVDDAETTQQYRDWRRADG